LVVPNSPHLDLKAKETPKEGKDVPKEASKEGPKEEGDLEVIVSGPRSLFVLVIHSPGHSTIGKHCEQTL